MKKSEYLHKVAKQYDYVSDLILEAEKSMDSVQRETLYSIAQSENNNLIKSLRDYISKVSPDKKLKAA